MPTGRFSTTSWPGSGRAFEPGERASPGANAQSGVSKGLEEAHHYLKYDTGLGDRLMTVAVLTTARELTNQFEWTQWEEHARTPKDTRYVEPKVIDAIKYCRPVTDLDAKDAAMITLGREMFGAAEGVVRNFREGLAAVRAPWHCRLEELMGLYAATAYELVVFDQQLHAGQKPLLPADAKSCLNSGHADSIANLSATFSIYCRVVSHF